MSDDPEITIEWYGVQFVRPHIKCPPPDRVTRPVEYKPIESAVLKKRPSMSVYRMNRNTKLMAQRKSESLDISTNDLHVKFYLDNLDYTPTDIQKSSAIDDTIHDSLTESNKFENISSLKYDEHSSSTITEKKILFPDKKLLNEMKADKKAMEFPNKSEKFQTPKPIRKHILTTVPFRMPRFFSRRRSITKLPSYGGISKASKWDIEDSYSENSFSTYGMLNYKSFELKLSDDDDTNAVVFTSKPYKPVGMRDIERMMKRDMQTRPKLEELLQQYVQEYFVKHQKQPIKTDCFWELEKVARKCIKHDKMLHQFLHKDLSFYPKTIRDFIAKANEVSQSMTPVGKSDKDASDQEKLPRTIAEDLPVKFNNTTYSPRDDVSAELLKDNYDFKRFLQHLILTKIYLTKPVDTYLMLNSKMELNFLINDITEKFLDFIDQPDAEIRREILVILKSSKININLLKFLSFSVDSWYDSMLGGLFSSYLSVVQDTCIIICFICFQPLLAQTIINNCQYDVAKDTVSILFKAMEHRPEYYSLFSIALSFIIGCSERFSVLEMIIDKASQTKQEIVMRKWPDFVYYASKLWKTQNLICKQQVVFKIIEHLEYSLMNRLSAFNAKRALSFYCKRCSFPTKLLTLWPL